MPVKLVIIEQLIDTRNEYNNSFKVPGCLHAKKQDTPCFDRRGERKEGRPYSFLPLLSPFPSRSQSMMRTLLQQGRGAKSALCSLARVVRKRSPQSVRPSLDDDNERGVLKREEKEGGSSAVGKMGIG